MQKLVDWRPRLRAFLAAQADAPFVMGGIGGILATSTADRIR